MRRGSWSFWQIRRNRYALVFMENRPCSAETDLKDDVVYWAPYESGRMHDIIAAMQYLNSETVFFRGDLTDRQIDLLEGIRREAAQRLPDFNVWLPGADKL